MNRTVPDFEPVGFFVLRTPLLPFDELLAWSADLNAAGALDGPARLEEVFWRDKAELRRRLVKIFERPELREALFVASPHLEQESAVCVGEPGGERQSEIERALVRYFARVAGRATPFGLCAGCSTGTLAAATHLAMKERGAYRRRSRLGIDYLVALIESLRRDPALRKVFDLVPNPTLYSAGGSLRLVTSRAKGKLRAFHLVTVSESDFLKTALERAAEGVTFASLAAALTGDGVSAEEAEHYVNELIEHQILMARLPVPVTGNDPAEALVQELRRHSETSAIANVLEDAFGELAAMDADGLGVAPARYRAIARSFEGFQVEYYLPQLFHLDLIKPGADATLGWAVIHEIARGVGLLHRMAQTAGHEKLTRFREDFMRRYERRQIPLAEALDEETGIGFGTGTEAAPLLHGLHFPAESAEKKNWGTRERFLLGKLSEALQAGSREIALTSADLDRLATKNPLPLPDSFAVLASIAAQSEAALAQGNFRLLLEGCSGPSGARLLGRFCHIDEELGAEVRDYLRAEEALQPGAIFAEVVHLPGGALANFITRPVLRGYEIPYLGESGAPATQQIPINDLTVEVEGDRIVLRSIARGGREVIPRMTNAHNYRLSHLGLYKFLCALQHQGTVEKVFWNWGALATAPFLPRVSFGRLVLSRAQWTLAEVELKRFRRPLGPALFREVQSWRAARALPRWVALVDVDNLLPIDLDNVVAVETLVCLVRAREEATLMELFPGPEDLVAFGPEGKYVHEMVVPFLRKFATRESSRVRPVLDASEVLIRSFPPGSDWLFAKIYAGATMADDILSEVVAPLVREILDRGAADRWFFVRYADPEWHIRLRFHGSATVLLNEVLPALESALSSRSGSAYRLQLDTYEREVERYGGMDGVCLAEQIFQADSEAVLEILQLLESGDQGLTERWQLALHGMDALLDDFGLDMSSRIDLLQQTVRKSPGAPEAEANLKAEISRKFRTERARLEQLLNRADAPDPSLLPGFEIIRRRSERIAPFVAELRNLTTESRLSVSLSDLAGSHIHMFANRLLRSAHGEQEFVLHEFLARLYRSRRARAGQPGME